MIRYLLDTDILTLYQNRHPRIRKRLKSHSRDEIGITVITVEEQLTGWYTYLRRAKSREKRAMAYSRLADSVSLLGTLHIVTYGIPAITLYDSLLRQKLGVRGMDLKIAAICLETNATLVTRNAQDFSRVPGLRLEDWSV